MKNGIITAEGVSADVVARLRLVAGLHRLEGLVDSVLELSCRFDAHLWFLFRV